MTTEHPITPPPGLIDKWRQEYTTNYSLARQAAHWAADQELEACCKVLHQHDRAYLLPSQLRAARRPKPPSLAEQATAELDIAVIRGDCITTSDAIPSLRAALERLKELEQQEKNDN